MLNIAVSYSKFATSESGGARESLLTLLRGVATTTDLTADVYQTPPTDDPPLTNFEYQLHTKRLYDIPKLTWTNQVISRAQWGRYLRTQLTRDTDCLVTQNRMAPVSVQVAAERNIPSLLFIRSMALTGYEKYDPSRSHLSNILRTDIGGRVQYPFLWKNFHEYKQATHTATYTIANSEFTARKIRELLGVDSEVIYPPIKLDKYRTEYDEDGYITMVNPRAAYKGADIFLDLADSLPHDEFLLVGPMSQPEIKQRATQLANVTHWEWCEDMREAYAMSKLVVVPSRWEEPFGRVPAEAMVSGIPCAVSNRGGLPEVVGDTGEVVTDIEQTDAWIEAINRALKSHDPQAQKQRVEMFSAANQIPKLVELLGAVR
ncbi:glycosyltransferase family 4 protein [Halorubrum sp. SY-15]|uniref:glycosyltransferase family 4 protein n=1 Tax=Halorubrum sp. SY-15 TaxID=3402277 RepID=UPI003EBF9562